MRPSVPSRWLRAAVFSALTGALALGAHLAGGGVLPAPAALGAGLAVLVLLSGAAAGRQRGWPALLAGTLAVQAGGHLILGLAAGRRPPGWQLASLVLCHSGPVPAHVTAGLPPLAGPAAAGWHLPGAAMLAGHLLAAVLLAGWLRHGERLAWQLAGAARLRLAALLRLPTPTMLPDYSRRVPRTPDRTARLAGALLARCAPVRGPPAACAA